jgi:hypothetical protein
MGAQSASDFGAGVVGCLPAPHLNALQEEREAAPGVSVLPLSGQGRQESEEVLPSSVEKKFWGQGRHWEPSVGWYVPAAHGVQLALDTAPAPSVVAPSGQSVHVEEPGAGAKVPTSHLPHAAEEVLPVRGLEVPSEQSVQLESDKKPAMDPYVPGGQKKLEPRKQ